MSNSAIRSATQRAFPDRSRFLITGFTISEARAITFQYSPSRSDDSIIVEGRSGTGLPFTGSADVTETDVDSNHLNITVLDIPTSASRRFMPNYHPPSDFWMYAGPLY